MKPIGHYLVVSPCASASISAGGIIVPESYKARIDKATVRALGTQNPKKLSVGQTIHHVHGAGEEIIENGEKVYIILQHDVLATE